MIDPLDNVPWVALSTVQQHFNTGNEAVKYFPAEVAPFIGLEHWNEKDRENLLQYLPDNRTFFLLVAQPVTLPEELEIVFTTPIYQMVCEKFIPGTERNIQTLPLVKEHVPQMIELTRLTRPGPFTQRTIEFGNYRGVFDEDKLVAMAGERLQVPGYTEVSAICTHPDYTGRGYAAHLLEEAMQRIIDAGNSPFLHVRADNTGAVELYKKRGFYIRKDVSFAVFRKK